MSRAGLLLLFLTLGIAEGSRLGALDLPVLRHARSSLLTEGVPDEASAARTNPVLRRTGRGYCAAWLDRRQGGLLMAARIDSDGTLQDPLGLPLTPFSNVYPGTVDLLVDDERCVVLLRDGEGFAINLEGDPDVQRTRPLDTTGGSSEIAAVEGDLAVIAESFLHTVRVTLVDSEGRVHWSHLIDGQHYGLRAAIIGETAWIVLQPPNRTGVLSVWRIDALGAVKLDPSVAAPTTYNWGVVAGGDSLVIVDSDPLPQVRFHRTDLEGQLQKTTVVDSTGGILEQLWSDGGAVKALLSHGESLTIIELRESGEVAKTTLPGLRDAAIADDGGESFSLWQNTSDRMHYGFGLPSQVPNTSISAAPRSELIADAEAGPGVISVLWVDMEANGSMQRLHHGLVDPLTLSVSGHAIVGEGAIIGTSASDHRIPRAAVEWTGNAFVIAWIEGSTLMMRRAAPDGSWMGDAIALSDAAQALHPDGLSAKEGGELLLVWTDADGDYGTRLRAVRISDSGGIVPWDPPAGIEPPDLTWAALAPSGEGTLVSVTHYLPGSCTITCPAPSFGIKLFDVSGDGVWTQLVHDVRYFSTEAIPTLVSAGARLLSISGDGGAYSFTRSGSVLTGASYHRIDHAVILGGVYWNGRFHVVSREASYPRAVGTLLSRIRDAEGFVETEVRIPDAGWASGFLPKVVALGDRLYIVSSEVSLEPEDGGVRRVRVHEIVPEVVRRRGVRPWP